VNERRLCDRCGAELELRDVQVEPAHELAAR
jgi:hypothetical protein